MRLHAWVGAQQALEKLEISRSAAGLRSAPWYASNPDAILFARPLVPAPNMAVEF